jgi:hypothetical protein
VAAPRAWSRTTVLCWALVAPAAVWALARGLGLERSGPAVQVISFTPYAAAASVIPLGIALLARRWWPAAVAGLACVALAACVLPRTVGGPTTAAGVELRVMSTNMRAGGAEVATIVDLVRRHRVDVLAVQEFTPDAHERLEAAGLSALLPHAERSAVEGVGGAALYSRHPLRDAARSLPAGLRHRRGARGRGGRPALGPSGAAVRGGPHRRLASRPAGPAAGDPGRRAARAGRGLQRHPRPRRTAPADRHRVPRRRRSGCATSARSRSRTPTTARSSRRSSCPAHDRPPMIGPTVRGGAYRTGAGTWARP